MEFQPNITLSTCWYELKCKFKPSVYMEWIDNMLSTVNSYNLVIYSDDKSSICLKKYLTNPKIKLIIKDICDFNNYKYKDYFIKNNSKNILLNSMVEWKVNLLWSEKTNFVYETMKNKYFDSEYYGWCDIGYFRQEKPY